MKSTSKLNAMRMIAMALWLELAKVAVRSEPSVPAPGYERFADCPALEPECLHQIGEIKKMAEIQTIKFLRLDFENPFELGNNCYVSGRNLSLSTNGATGAGSDTNPTETFHERSQLKDCLA